MLQQVLHSMFHLPLPVLEKVLRPIIVYLCLIGFLRLFGKRELAQLNPFDLVVLLSLSNTVQNAIIGSDNSVIGGVIGAVTLVVVDSVLNRLALYSEVFARIFDGTSTEVIRDGVILETARRLGLRKVDLERAVRLQNGDNIGEVKSAVFEPSGHLIVTLRPDEQSATKGDIDLLTQQLKRIEAALAARA
jgi:uncharacterized membrane protein YcaP (DUF421 family)